MRFHEAYLVGRLEETKISHQSVCFTRISDFTWRVSDCEELVGHQIKFLKALIS